MSSTVHFYWDIGSTNTYFALHLLGDVIERRGAHLVMHPFNLGYVFRHHKYTLMDEPKAKLANRRRDLERWAERYNLPFRMPDKFPIKTSHLLRGALVARDLGVESPYIHTIFRRYWEENDSSLETLEGLVSVAEEIGENTNAFLQACASDFVRDELIDETQAALKLGVFGAPSYMVSDELFWGKDRIDFVDAYLQSLETE